MDVRVQKQASTRWYIEQVHNSLFAQFGPAKPPFMLPDGPRSDQPVYPHADEGDHMLCETIAAGPTKWRQVVTKELGAFFNGNRAQVDYLADVWFGEVVVIFNKRFPGRLASQILDSMEVVSPPTQKEIDDAWVVELGDSEEAMRQFWEGSARVRTGLDIGAKDGRPLNAMDVVE